MSASGFVLEFSKIRMTDVSRVGGKNASLGELFTALRSEGVEALDGFATTSDAYYRLLRENDLENRLREILKDLDPADTVRLQSCGKAAREAILSTPLPVELRESFLTARKSLLHRLGRETTLAVRSSATAEDLPTASFAGAAETFLNVSGEDELLEAIHKCFASLFTDRAINYRAQLGYDHMKVALSVGVQPMVRADLACAGVIFTLDTETGFRDVVVITSSFGLGEYVVQGVVSPDEWTVFKPTLLSGHDAIIGHKLGSKEARLVYGDEKTSSTRREIVSNEERRKFSLCDEEVLKLARWSCAIEKHYSQLAGHEQPMDIEWAKDGITNALFILQARPETVHSMKKRETFRETYRLKAKPPEPIVVGQSVGEKIGVGIVRIVRAVEELSKIKAGEILVATNTNPDWEPVMKRVAAIVTDQGGRTAHAAIVSRELGLPCVVGCGNASEVLQDGEEVTVSCAEGNQGRVYRGRIPFEVERIETSTPKKTRTQIMFNVADPAQAFSFAALPNDGVGLARLEFIITNHIGVHPMALARFPNLKDENAKVKIQKRLLATGLGDPKEFFVQKLAEGIGKIAAAFFPKPVIVRASDFKTNEYAQLLGGAEFEPREENPMLGFRGASRYYDPRYAEGFALECAALKRVRDKMGLTNVKVMIPFCRTVKEAQLVVGEMAKHGLRQGENALEIYAMCELPSNVTRADDFLKIFDGYSIGSNDLTQLVLGLDRDSGTVAHLFDEDDPAVKDNISAAIKAALAARKPIGICGQAPSDKPEFAAWLVSEGITSISLTPDSSLKARQFILEAELNNKQLRKFA